MSNKSIVFDKVFVKNYKKRVLPNEFFSFDPSLVGFDPRRLPKNSLDIINPIMNSYLLFVTSKIKNHQSKIDPKFNAQKYMGTSHKFLGITNPQKHKIAAEFKKIFPEITFSDLIELLNNLNTGQTFEEKTMGPMILMRYKILLNEIRPKHLGFWLDNLEGWCEIDTLCQNTIPAQVLLDNWSLWKDALTNWSTDKLISKRRASLVLLCNATRKSDNQKLKNLSFDNIERLKHEKDILITKAISWLLRSMIKNFKNDVAEYLKNNKSSLPKIAVRETRKKLLTGRKN